MAGFPSSIGICEKFHEYFRRPQPAIFQFPQRSYGKGLRIVDPGSCISKFPLTFPQFSGGRNPQNLVKRDFFMIQNPRNFHFRR